MSKSFLDRVEVLDAAAHLGVRNTTQVANYISGLKNFHGTLHPAYADALRAQVGIKVGQILKTMSLKDMEYMEAMNPGMFMVSTQEIYVRPLAVTNNHDLAENQNYKIDSIDEYRHGMELIIADQTLAQEAADLNKIRMEWDAASHERFIKSLEEYGGQ